MTIDLIAKNKVAAYIQRDPEAYTYLMTWIKESKNTNRRYFDMNAPDGTAIGLSQLGASKYSIKLKLNIRLQTAYIIFLGTREEEMAYMDQEIAEYEAKHPGAKIMLVVKTSTVTLKAPDIPREVFEQQRTLASAVSTNLDPHQVVGGNNFIFPENIHSNCADLSLQGYEDALERAINIFNSQPDTDEFKELERLLQQIKGYESMNIIFPCFSGIEAIKLRMRDFKLIPENLMRSASEKEDIDLFLAGKKLLPDQNIEKIYKQLGLKLKIDRDDFIIE